MDGRIVFCTVQVVIGRIDDHSQITDRELVLEHG
jgi:hypothetical protein